MTLNSAVNGPHMMPGMVASTHDRIQGLGGAKKLCISLLLAQTYPTCLGQFKY